MTQSTGAPQQAPAPSTVPVATRPITPDLRQAEVGRVLSLLGERTSVTVVGRRGAGRSTLVRHVVERLTSEGVNVVHVRGLRALRDRPLSALAVAGVHISATPGQLPALTSALTSLESLVGARGSSVLVVDDADDLDPTSAGAIAALHEHRQVPVLLTMRHRGRRQNNNAGLITAGTRAARVALDPLTFDQVLMYVHGLLPGAVDPTAVARIAAKSGGLPGLVAAIVEHGRRDYRLVLRDGLWTVRGDLWTTALAEAAEPMLVDLGEVEFDALTLLAAAGTLPLVTARELVAPEVLADLDDRGLLQVLPTDATEVVGVFPPLLGDYCTHEGPTVRNLLARERLAAAGLGAVSGADGTSKAGQAVIVRMLRQHVTARCEARRRAWEADASAAHGSALVEAMLEARSRPYEIDAVLERTRVAEADGDGATLATWAALYRASAGGTRAEALAELDAACQAGSRAHAVLRAGAARVELVAGDLEQARAAVRPLDPGATGHPLLIPVAAEIELASGDADRALALLDTLPAEAGEHISALRGLAAVLQCRLDDAVRDALEGVRRGRAALEPVTVLEHAYVAAFALWLQGRAVELNGLVSSVLELGAAPLHRRHDEAALLTLAASGAHWRNQPGYARVLATEAATLRGLRGPHPWMDAAEEPALMPDASDRDVAQALWDLANERLERGFVSAGVVAGVRSLERSGCPERAHTIARIAAGSGSPLLVRLADYATALASRDVDELERQEAVLRHAGLGQMAVRTAVARSVELMDRGEMTAAISHADAAWSQAGLRGRDLCGLFNPLDQAVNLTARERELAVAVARGYTNQEIAARMVLSVRTVENHVFAACRKLQVDNREDLGRAARTWLTCGRQ
ncbi:AAA family ATPase [Georgenia yuyongxinii]|uniref:AAA family ATPase n=1 Tax=Georgenia yuyongxinii TaxID=2589797 RepID=A0A5B8C5W6_9MICO|nr:AAA family ATPase [Georgenia yuyongxinii]